MSSAQPPPPTRRSEGHFRALLEYAPDAIIVVDGSGTITVANEETERLFGYPRAELIGRPVELLLPADARRRHREHRDRFLAFSNGRRRMGRDLTLRGRRRDGTEFPIEVSLGPLDSDGERHVAAIVRDVSERLRLESELRQLADRDELTGLLNRRRFTEKLVGRLADRSARVGALLLVDLDNFKYVNDTLGHNAGDAVIRAAGRLLRSQVRAGDLLARLGGDEFIVLLPGATEEQALALAERVLIAFEHELPAADVPGATHVTASIGVSSVRERDAELTAEQLLSQADIALYAAKEGGRNRASSYEADTGTVTRMQDDLSRANRLHRAFAEDGFVLYAQPIVPLQDPLGQPSFELLLRLRDRDGVVHSPGDFLALGERFGLARRIDRWVIAESFRLAAAHAELGTLSVNLSATSLADGANLADYVAAQAEATGVDPRQFHFEVTETAAIANLAAAGELADRLRALGCRLVLDDFGTGFGTFSSLKQLPFDALKIDGSFIRGLCDDATDQVIVRSMVSVAHGLGKTVTAEWVEDERTRRRLVEYGVDYAQGYHLGRPLPAAEAVRGAAA